MSKRSLRECKNPFLAQPFEAFSSGSWCTVKHLRIADGKIMTYFEGSGSTTDQNVPLAHLRVRSRRANPYDCICFLRTGVDVCVLLSDACHDSPELAWVDAKINSVERKPHLHGCSCRFYVRLNTRPFCMDKKKINGEIKEVRIDNIAILQKLGRKPYEDGYFRWMFSKNCTSVSDVKLFRGQFIHDALWLLVTSSLKGVEFKISSMDNKIMYQVLDGCFGDNNIVKTMNFRVEDDGVLRPIILTFSPEVPTEISAPIEATSTALIQVQNDGYEPISLRRSRRRNVQPERFVGEGFWKGKPYVSKTERKRKSEEAEFSSGILSDSDSEYSLHSICSEHTNMNESDGKNMEISSNTLFIEETLQAEDYMRIETTTARKKPIQKKAKSAEVQRSSYVSHQTNKNIKYSLRSRVILMPKTSSVNPVRTESENVLLDKHDDAVKRPRKVTRVERDKHDDVVERPGKVARVAYKRIKSGSEKKKKSTPKKKNREKKKKVQGTSLDKEVRSTHSFYSRRKMYRNIGANKTPPTKREYTEIIEKCMKNIDSEFWKHQPPAGSQWEEIRSYQWWKLPQPPPSKDPVENPELVDMWKEMEMSINPFQFLEENLTRVAGVLNKSSADDGKPCPHEYILDEQIGTICRFCRSVDTEIRYILPPFVNNASRFISIGHDHRPADDVEWKLLDEAYLSRDTPSHENNGSVWALIPNLRDKLHCHQKKAFEFLWKNIAGSLLPANMDGLLERTGGCVISHAPGAGKTLLMIAFLVSYLKLFPGRRPLILAPKTTLHTWYKEFEKWEVSIPVYQIYARRNYKKDQQNKTARTSIGRSKVNRDIRHAIDCMKKFEKWHQHASVLLMSYPSFVSITKSSSNLKHWRYMAGVLRQSPSLLIFDEGHNPRSTRSMMRKSLMQVKTEHRVLLSGTVFQNTFEEYFNTLCLARPAFISEVLRALDPASRRNRYRQGFIRNEKEKRARKFFVEEVANRILSKVDKEKTNGLRILKKITHGFIDVYEGDTSHTLPGLRSYKLLIKPTVMQQEFLSMLRKISGTRYPLELELLITLLSIHPWLITSVRYSKKYYSQDDLKELEKYKLDLHKGSKVRFVVSLVWKCIGKREKVLIFCRNIAPIKLLVEIFGKIFGWTKGDQVLVLSGEQESWERSRVIDKFEESGGSSQVLLASISACSEGISLTAASRVVFLDSEWNPSRTKQAVARAFRPGQEKVVYVYQLLASGTMEEDKYGKNTWKERVSRMISVGAGPQDQTCRPPEDVDDFDDEVLKEIIKEDQGQSVHVIKKKEQLSCRWNIVGDEASMLALGTL